MVNNDTLGKTLVNYINETLGINVSFFSSISLVSENKTYVIDLTYNEKEDSYKIKWIERINNTAESQSLRIFDSTSEEDSTDLFLVNNSLFNSYDTHIYILLQSYFSKFLIKTKTHKDPEKNIYFRLGYNS